MQTVLIIDDDAHMLTSLGDVLSGAGYRVASAESGAAALRAAEQEQPDLVVSDVRMAEMDGIECIGRLRAGIPGLKSIVITGYASLETPARAMDLDSSDYLCKPFTAEQLVQSVERALASPGNGLACSPEMQESADSLRSLDFTRQRALQNFYLGIRSGHLTAAAALPVWSALEAVELRRLEAERELRLRLEVLDLQDAYLTLCEYCKNPSHPALAQQKPVMGRLTFQPFFQNIRAGSVSSEQLKQAAGARQEPGQELHRLLWTARLR